MINRNTAAQVKKELIVSPAHIEAPVKLDKANKIAICLIDSFLVLVCCPLTSFNISACPRNCKNIFSFGAKKVKIVFQVFSTYPPRNAMPGTINLLAQDYIVVTPYSIRV
jgi:hypothetical protein